MRSIALLSIILLLAACSKSSDNYTSGYNYTVGMLNSRTWSDNSNGYVPGDSVISGTAHHNWPVHYNHDIADTVFTLQKINDFALSINGNVVQWRTTDSTAKTVRFDSVISGTYTSILMYYYDKDSITYTYSKVSGYFDSAQQYFQVNAFLHTHR